MKVGRNDPCPCGSGKKYKRCCGDPGRAVSGQPPDSLPELVANAHAAVSAGDYRRAVRDARLAIRQRPNDPTANHICGVALVQLGDHSGARHCFEIACSATPVNPVACSNLGRVRELLGDLDGAETANLRALAHDPMLADAHNNLGNIMRARGRIADAITRYRKAIELAPENPSYAVNLCSVFLQNGEVDQVERVLSPIIDAKVPFAPAYLTLGMTYLLRARSAEAVQCFERADALRPNDPLTLVNLGTALGQLRSTERAAEAYERAFAIDPAYLAAYAGNLMTLYLGDRCFDRAHGLAMRVLSDQRAKSRVLGAASSVFGATCDFARRYLALCALKPLLLAGDVPFKALLECHYTALFSDDELLKLHRLAAGSLECGIDSQFAHRPDPASGLKRLRIGYLSSDFREHAMSFLVTPFLQRHDPDQFEVYAYMTHQTEDSVTDSIRRYCRGFRNISGLTDKEAANLIHADGIDVLVDLSGHTTGSRPGILAKRPAPIQATYLGYPDTTGLSVVDYVILDPYIAEGTTQHVESPALLPECLVTFSELPLSPAEVSAPVSRNGFVTFGSLNNLSKLTTSVVACWAEILRRAPTSRLLIAYNGADAPITQENLRYEFGHHGIDKERVMLRAGGARSEFLEHYREVDIFLDTFPYTGTTTTCEALLMNVPVVTLTGTRQCNRVSASILNHLGLSNLVAATIEQYASIAVELGTDSSRLLALRKTLPERLKVSTLQDPKRFTRGLEALYRAMWVRWNGGQRRGAIAVPGRAGN